MSTLPLTFCTPPLEWYTAEGSRKKPRKLPWYVPITSTLGAG